MRKFRFVSAFLIFIFSFGIISELDAAQYDIKKMTPAIEQAINGRKARYDQLQALKAEGMIGEDNQGFVVALKSTPDAIQISGTENADRMIIYEAIASQNKLGADGLEKV